MKPIKNKALAMTADIAVVIFGTMLYAAGVYFFTSPADIAPGGVIGIATILNKLWGIPIGVLTFSMNIPLVILAFIYLGKKLAVKTLIALVTFSLTVDSLLSFFPAYTGDKLIASIFGGALIGLGLGTVYTRDATTGGFDVINWLIQKKLPYLKIGTITLATDVVIFLLAALAFRHVDAVLYSGISVFVTIKVIDLIMYGMSESKLMLIITDRPHPISEEILKLQRGVTRLKAVGAYSGEEKNVIMCAAAKNQYTRVKRIVTAIDPKAFIIITNAGEVFGEGFMPISKQ